MPSAGSTNTSDLRARRRPDLVALETRIVGDFASLDTGEWELLDHQDNPFLSRAFLAALE